MTEQELHQKVISRSAQLAREIKPELYGLVLDLITAELALDRVKRSDKNEQFKQIAEIVAPSSALLPPGDAANVVEIVRKLWADRRPGWSISFMQERCQGAKAPKARHKINDRFGLHPRQNASCFEGRQEKLSATERNKNGLSDCFYDCFYGLLPRPKGLKSKHRRR